jgi:hypothetical protein
MAGWQGALSTSTGARGQFPAPPIKFPAPLKKFPAPASREFVCRPLISQRFLTPESPEKALFSKNSLLNSLLPGNLVLRPVVSVWLLSHGVGLYGGIFRRAVQLHTRARIGSGIRPRVSSSTSCWRRSAGAQAARSGPSRSARARAGHGRGRRYPAASANEPAHLRPGERGHRSFAMGRGGERDQAVRTAPAEKIILLGGATVCTGLRKSEPL